MPPSQVDVAPSPEAASPGLMSPEALSPGLMSPEALSPEALSPEIVRSEVLHQLSRRRPRKRKGGGVRQKLVKAMSQAIHDFSMIREGDHILCAVSGGKDSYVLHELLVDLKRRAPVCFDVTAVNVDQGHPGYPREVLTRYMAERGHAFRMVSEDTYSIVRDKIPEGATTCSLCSRLRRAILYRAARELGCNKVALGHHRDDVVTTLMLNLFFSGQLKAMPPKLVNDEGDVVVLRPLAYCAEDDIASYAKEQEFPIIPCVLCGTQDGMQRAIVSEMLSDMDRRSPGIRQSMLAALRNVRPSHLLDSSLWAKLDLAVAHESEQPARACTSEPLASTGAVFGAV